METKQTRPHSVGIVGMGTMGHRVAAELRAHGHDVMTCLAGRSEHSKVQAAKANIRLVESVQDLVDQADLILSIVPPEVAMEVAQTYATCLRSDGGSIVFVDCNAISPERVRKIDALYASSPHRFLDASLIGGPPAGERQPRLYVSGPEADRLMGLDGHAVHVKVIGTEIGQASGLKMSYAALTKGMMTLQSSVLMLADRLGLYEALTAELADSQAEQLQRMKMVVPFIAPDSGRWVGEMEEIAATYAAVGLPDGFHRAAAEIFAAASETELGARTRDTIDWSMPLEDVVRTYAEKAVEGKAP